MTRREACQKMIDAQHASHDHITDDTEYGQVVEVLNAATDSGTVTVERRTLVPLTGEWTEGIVSYRKP